MKYLILTDIHGSSYYLEKVLNEVKGFDHLIILGDVLYHGPRNDLPMEYDPKRVIKILNDLKDKIIAIRGNCDANVDLMVLDFNFEEHKWINIENKMWFLTHGDVFNKTNVKIYDDHYYMLYGHYHINEIIDYPDVTCINLGSITLPKDNHHSYAIIEDNVYTCYDIENKEIIFTRKINNDASI